MQQKNIIIYVVVSLLFIGGIIFALSGGEKKPQTQVENTQNTTQPAIPNQDNNTETPNKVTPTNSQTNTGGSVSPTPASTPSPAPLPVSAGPTSYTFSQVQSHNGVGNCWSAINGKVYDLTSWIASHPGGEGAILSICGKDGSSAFNNQHGGSNKTANVLKEFEIGLLL